MSDIDALIRQINVLEQRLDELVLPEVGRWINWSPTITQGVAVTVTISYARYIIFAESALTQVALTVTSGGTGGQPIVIGNVPSIIQPTNILSNISVIGDGLVLDQGVAWYGGPLVVVAASDWRFMQAGSGAYVGTIPNFSLANTDKISFMAVYER